MRGKISSESAGVTVNATSSDAEIAKMYEAAKARIWADLGPDAVAVANADDPVVMAHAPATALTFRPGRSRKS